jgi:hypothetical protein
LRKKIAGAERYFVYPLCRKLKSQPFGLSAAADKMAWTTSLKHHLAASHNSSVMAKASRVVTQAIAGNNTAPPIGKQPAISLVDDCAVLSWIGVNPEIGDKHKIPMVRNAKTATMAMIACQSVGRRDAIVRVAKKREMHLKRLRHHWQRRPVGRAVL